MRVPLILAFSANLVLILVSVISLPERVAIHFGPGGLADGWASRETYAALLMLTELPLFALLLALPRLLRRLPAKWINLPNREHWLSDENILRSIGRITRYTDEFGTATFGFLFVAGLLSFEANRLDPPRLDEGLFLISLAAFLIYTVIWTVRLLLAFRLPRDKRDPR
jgi:hypothetical protein